jgi:hypothetical protein
MVLRAALELIRWFSQMNEGQLLDRDIAFLRDLNGRRDFADQAQIGQILARGSDAFDVKVPLEPCLDLAARPASAASRR